MVTFGQEDEPRFLCSAKLKESEAVASPLLDPPRREKVGMGGSCRH